MDAKKERSISRMREEIEIFEPIMDILREDPDEMARLQLLILEDLTGNNKTIIECVEKDKPFLASQFTNPVEMLTAMDVPWYFHVQQQFVASGTGGSPHTMEDLEEMDKLGIPPDCCTLIRLLLYYQADGLLPIPTAYLALTEPCDAVVGMHSVFMKHPDWRNVPVFVPDPPYLNNERSIDYFASEMRRMVDFITEHTGKTLDINRLKEIVEETNKCYALWHEYNDLRRAIPTPHSYVMPMSCFYRVNTAGAGYPVKTEWYKAMVANAEKRVRENTPEVPNQKIRVFWYDIQPMFFSEIVPWMEQEWGAVIAMDMISYCPHDLIDTSTEDNMFRGLAKRAFQDPPMIHQGRGLADNVIHDITRVVKDHKIDCVVFPGHVGHKDMAANVAFMRETCRELGVPFMYLGIDMADKRYTTVDEIKDKMSQFFTSMGLG